jgi:hypothetical protein
MPYQITLSSGSLLVNLADNTTDTTTSLTLVGRNYPGYGQAVANNFVRLLENAANVAPPSAPLVGQLWYDTANVLMKVWTGSTWFSLTTGVSSFLGLSGPITLQQIIGAGLAPLNSPAFTGVPTAPTPPSGTNSNQIATVAYVLNQIGSVVGGVSSVLGATGAVTLAQLIGGGLAPLGSPAFTGVPTAPTPPIGSNNNQVATTSYVIAQVGALSTGVSSVIGATGNVTLDQLNQGGVAIKASPAFTGVPTAPTAAVGTNTNQLATTAFVSAALGSLTPTNTAKTRTISGSVTAYVNPATGNDSTGVPGQQGQPFATMQGAYNYVANNLDGGGGAFQIILSSTTHTVGLVVKAPLVGFPDGVVVTSATGQGLPGQAQQAYTTTIVSVSNGTCFLASGGGIITVRGLTVAAPTGSNTNAAQSGNCLSAINGGIINVVNTATAQIIFGQSAGFHIFSQNLSQINVQGSYQITGGASGHYCAAESSVLSNNGIATASTVTLTNTPSFSIAFAYSLTGAYLGVPGVVFSGAATGRKFSVAYGGGVYVSGAGLNYLPGNSAGTGSPEVGATAGVAGFYV